MVHVPFERKPTMGKRVQFLSYWSDSKESLLGEDNFYSVIGGYLQGGENRSPVGQ